MLFGTIYNILHGTTESAELIFSNKLDQYNKGYYKLTQFIDYMEPGINMNLKLKIYKDKNFVIIEPKVLYSYLPLINTELNIDNTGSVSESDYAKKTGWLFDDNAFSDSW